MAIRQFPRASAKDYRDIRSNIQSGDLLLCSGSGPISRAIQLATGSHWSHVGFVMPLPAIDRVMVLESVETIGVRTVPLSKYLGDYDNDGKPYPGGLAIARHDEFPTNDGDTLREFSQRAVDMFGYPYDNREVAKIGLRILASAVSGVSKDDDLARDKEYICSEYVYECYQSVGITIPFKGGFITPADFANARQVRLQAVLQRRPV